MITHWLDKAATAADASEALIELGLIGDSVNRSYYSLFNTLRAMIAHVNPEFVAKKHGSLLSEFQLLYVKTGRLDVVWGKTLNRIQGARHAADYGDDAIDAAEARDYLSAARKLLAHACEVLPPGMVPHERRTIPQDALMSMKLEAAAKGALADALCKAMKKRGEVLPPGLSADLVLYGEAADLEALIVDIDEMQDASSYVRSRVPVPTFG